MRTNRNGVNLIIHFSTMMAFLLILLVITVAIDCFVPILQKGDFRGVAFDWISVAAAMSVPVVSFVFRKMAENQRFRFAINDELLCFMERNCCNHLSIQEIATKCGYSAEHFSRTFKKYKGVSPAEYMMTCRVKRAKELLINSDKPIDILIDECGFSDRTAFYKKFYEYVGCTPLQFRKGSV